MLKKTSPSGRQSFGRARKVFLCLSALSAATLILSLALLSGCWRNESPGSFPQASVILISVDTLRSDRLPVYGYKGIATPYLDQFAADGMVFERAYSQSPLTLPSHASLFTGLLPTEHGVRDNSFYALSDEYTTLAERLAGAGYVTGGVISSVILGPRTGIQQGFQFYQSNFQDEGGQITSSRAGEQSVRLALAWLANQPQNQPNFLFLHIFEPHTPYQPPEPFASSATNPYDGEVVYTDHLLGQFFSGLKQLGRYDSSLITLVSDHGEGLGDHGEAEHGILLHREALQVPFIMKLPGGKLAGKRFERPAMLADLKPTLERMLDLTPEAVSGRDLFNRDTDWQKRPLFAETRYPFNNFGYPAGQSVVRGEFHYLNHGEEALFQMISDPGETENLLPEETVPAPILGYLEVVGEGIDFKQGEAGGDLELLASLGYSAVQVEQAQHLDRPISELIEAIQELDQAAAWVEAGDIEKAKSSLDALLQRQPCLHQARLDLGRLMQLEGQWQTLATHYEQALLCDAKNLRFLMLTGQFKIRAGRFDEARRLADQVMAIGTQEAKGEFAYYFQRYGAPKDAAELARLLWQESQPNPHAGLILGKQAYEKQAYAEALGFLGPARIGFQTQQEFSLLASASFLIGECRRMNGELDAALSAYRNALQHQPNDSATRAATALVLAGKGQTRDAIKVIDEWVRDFPSRASYTTAAKVMTAINQPDAAAFFQKQSLKYPEISQ